MNLNTRVDRGRCTCGERPKYQLLIEDIQQLMSSMSAVAAAMSPGSLNIIYHNDTFPLNVRPITDS